MKEGGGRPLLQPLRGTDGQRVGSWAGSHPQNVGVSLGGLARG